MICSRNHERLLTLGGGLRFTGREMGGEVRETSMMWSGGRKPSVSPAHCGVWPEMGRWSLYGVNRGPRGKPTGHPSLGVLPGK